MQTIHCESQSGRPKGCDVSPGGSSTRRLVVRADDDVAVEKDVVIGDEDAGGLCQPLHSAIKCSATRAE